MCFLRTLMDGKAKRIMVASKLSLEWWIATLEDKKKKAASEPVD